MFPVLRERHSKERSQVFEQRRPVTGAPRVALQGQGSSHISANLQRLSLQGRHAQIRKSSYGPASSKRSRDLEWYLTVLSQCCSRVNDASTLILVLFSVLEENPLCKDGTTNCNLVAQARLCAYQFYQQLCCQSCSRAKQEVE